MSLRTKQEEPLVIGILALQGAFLEHQAVLQGLTYKINILPLLVKSVEELERCDALIIPGGESTTMAVVARATGILEPLRKFVREKPVWGTCAGAILLSQTAEGMKRGGQDLLGGVSISIARNGWGSQVESFETDLMVQGLKNPEQPFRGIFIRAPVVLSFNSSSEDPPIQVIARLSPELLPEALAALDEGDPKTVVALRQARHLLTTFHPELTLDNRFHEYFLRECVQPATR